jgi:hypothetical protein
MIGRLAKLLPTVFLCHAWSIWWFDFDGKIVGDRSNSQLHILELRRITEFCISIRNYIQYMQMSSDSSCKEAIQLAIQNICGSTQVPICA